MSKYHCHIHVNLFLTALLCHSLFPLSCHPCELLPQSYSMLPLNPLPHSCPHHPPTLPLCLTHSFHFTHFAISPPVSHSCLTPRFFPPLLHSVKTALQCLNICTCDPCVSVSICHLNISLFPQSQPPGIQGVSK